MAFVGSLSAALIYRHLNTKKEARCREENIDRSRGAEFEHLGNKSPLFRYVLRVYILGKRGTSSEQDRCRYTI
jgi:hypothetical protein